MATRVTTQGYGSKIGDSFKGIIGGIIAIIIAVVLLWWNEKNSVDNIKTIAEGKKVVNSIDANTYSDQFNQELVHLTGLATTNDSLRDNEFGFAVNAIKLKKVVEMYQYKENKKTETKDNLGGSTTTTETFTYEKVWSNQLINSDQFYEQGWNNPKAFEHQSTIFIADNVTLGEYSLSDGLIGKIGGYEDYPIGAAMYDTETNNGILSGGVIYFGGGPKYPSIGDERISYSVIYPKDISVIAQQSGKSFVAYQTKKGKAIELVYSGSLSAQEIFAKESSQNSILTWILRFVGFFVMAMGFSMILRPLSAIGSVIPLVGNIVGAGAGIIAGAIAFALSFIIIALAWFFYRPILSIILIVVGVGAFILVKRWLADKNATKNEQNNEQTS